MAKNITGTNQGNRLLAALPPRAFAHLKPHLHTVPLLPQTMLTERGAPLRHAWFPDSGAISLLAVMGETVAETATVGPEGFLGIEALLGGQAAISRSVVALAGTASRISIRALRTAVEHSDTLRDVLLGYVRYFQHQALQSVACNGLHSVQQRSARWLLTAHDHAKGDTIHVTQEFMAQMLGIRRPSATIVARSLQDAGLIRYSRGVLTITDRAGLRQEACDCYAIIRHALNGSVRAQK